MIGLGGGGVWGLADGIRNREVVGSARLRATTILNGITRRGPFLANTTAVLGKLCTVYSVIVVSLVAIHHRLQIFDSCCANIKFKYSSCISAYHNIV